MFCAMYSVATECSPTKHVAQPIASKSSRRMAHENLPHLKMECATKEDRLTANKSSEWEDQTERKEKHPSISWVLATCKAH